MNTISVDEAENYYYSPIAIQEVSEHRWYTKQLVVFNKHGELYGFYYLEPATELQEGQDRFENDPVEIFPVSSREVKTTVYEVVS